MPCPNIDFCPAKIKIRHYMDVCLSEDGWRSCKHYTEYELTPANWKKLLKHKEESSSLF